MAITLIMIMVAASAACVLLLCRRMLACTAPLPTDRPACADRLPSARLLQLMEMIEEADRDGDGEINQEEFLRIMKKTNLF